MKNTSTLKITLLLLIITAASIIPVYAGGSIVNKEFIKGAAPLSEWGIGDGLYKVTYSDGSSEYQIMQGKLLSIVSMTPEVQNINIGQYGAAITYTVKADVSPTMAGSSTLNYKYRLYSESCSSGTDLGTGGNFYMTYGQTMQATFSGKSPYTAAGEYKYCLRETVEMVSVSPPVWARGNDFYIKVIVTDPNTQPTTTAIATPGTTIPTASATTTVPVATQSPNIGCGASEINVGGQCAKVIPQTPGFEISFAILGILIIAYFRRKP